MSFLTKLGGLFGNISSLVGNRNFGHGGRGNRGATIPRAPIGRPAGEEDELADAEATMAEAQAAGILHDLDAEEQRLISGEWIESPESSNVTRFKWVAGNEELQIQFHDGAVYGYMEMTLPEALEFLHAGSKGGQVWDQLRIRKSKLGHRKPYVYYSGPSGNNRKWYQAGPEASAEHGREADRQSGPFGGNPFGKGGLGRKRGNK